jgi:small subunit ribosomal protein S8
MTDPISDMLTRIRNAQAAGLATVSVPFSRIKQDMVNILEKEGFIGKSESKGRKTKKDIEIVLKYENGKGVVLGLKRISKPGQRIYIDSTEIRTVRDGFGISIISTSKGLMTNKDAWKQKLGGELICQIW